MGVSTFMVKPIEVSVSSFNIDEPGIVRMSSDDSSFGISLRTSGSQVSIENSDFTVDVGSQWFGGDVVKRARPDAYGVMPRNFSEPFTLRYSVEEGSGPERFLGQSEMYSRKFLKFDVDGNLGTRPFRNTHGTRLFSYDGQMYMLNESYTWYLGERSNLVKLYRWDDSTNKFGLWHVFFNRLIDKGVKSPDSQYGSPDVCVVDGKVYICYRYIDRIAETNNFILYSSDGDLRTWEKVSETLIQDTYSVDFDQFRLRIAGDLDTLMVVIYGTHSYTRESAARDVENHDMRSYLSFNKGSSFTSRSKSHSGVTYRESEGLSRNQDFQNLSEFFVVNVEGPATEDSFVDYNVGFDLYFDKDMGSFVILKGGDPILWRNREHLVGIKTSSSSLFSWEPCLRYLMNIEANGDAILNGSFDVFNSYSSDDANSYIVNDVEVVEGDASHNILMSVTVAGSEYSSTNSVNTVVGEFRFVPDSYISPGLYDSVYAYGGKFHSEYSFTCSPFHKDSQGILAGGVYMDTGDIQNTVSDPIGCRWRNQLVCSEKRIVNDYSGYSYLCIMNPWSNMGERYGYEFAYSTFYPGYEEFHLEKVEANGGSIDYSEADQCLKADCGTGVSAEDGYVQISKAAAVLSLPGLLERAGSGDGLWKVKFGFKFDAISTEFKIFEGQCTDVNTDGYTLSVTLDTSGNINLKNSGGTTQLSLDGIEIDTEYTVCLGICKSRSGEPSYFLCLTEDETYWRSAGLAPANKINGGSFYARYGMIESQSGGTILDIYNPCFSCYGKQFRNPVGRTMRENFNGVDAAAYYLEDFSIQNPYFSRPAEYYSHTVGLHDGSELEFIGVHEESKTSWVIEDVSTVNNSQNCLNGTANFNYDFTNRSEAPEYTHTLYLDKETEESWDTLSLINLYGVYRVDVSSGTYDPVLETWSDLQSENFEIPYLTLDVISYSGRTIVISDTYQKSQILGMNILVYDTASEAYVSQYIVKENFLGVVVVDANMVDLSDKELRLFKPSAAFDLLDTVSRGNVDHIGIKFYTPPVITLGSIGQIHIGNRRDLTSHVTSLESLSLTTDEFQESETGMLFGSDQKRGDRSLVSDVRNYTMDVMTLGFGSAKSYRDYLMNIALAEDPVVIVSGSPDIPQRVDFGYLSGAITDSRTGFVSSIGFSHSVQFFEPVSRAQDINRAPALSTTVSSNQVSEGESVDFSASAVDREGDAVSFSWDFGDGSPASILAAPSHSFSDEGQYTVTCTAVDSEGNTAVSEVHMYVLKKETVTYEVDWTGSGTVPEDTYVVMTITAKDESGAILSDNSFDRVVVLSVGAEFDTDFDDVTDATDTVVLTMSEGVATVAFLIPTAGVRDFYVVDYQETFTVQSIEAV